MIVIDTIRDFVDAHESLRYLIIAVVIFILALGGALAVARLVLARGSSESYSYYYEYTDTGGEMHIAEYCGGWSTPYCQLSDGTRVFDIKSWKRVKED